MDVRKDFKDVEGIIFRLLGIGNEFNMNDDSWSHLKNREDFREIYQLPMKDQSPFSDLYSIGRDMAIFMSDALSSINYNFSTYPTLTSVVKRFEGTWVYRDYAVLEEVNDVRERLKLNIWAVDKMYTLFAKQLELLKAVASALAMLKASSLYKQENGEEIVTTTPHGIHVSGVSGSNVIVNSSGASAQINNALQSPVFADMLAAINAASTLQQSDRDYLKDCVQKLEASHKSGGFKEGYKEFMQNASAHVTIFAALLPTLALLL